MGDDSRPSRQGDPDFAYISESMTNMFQSNDRIVAQQQDETHGIGKGLSKAKKKELELALTILLVELASSDQSFDGPEYQMIVLGLYRMFGTGKAEVGEMINQSLTILENLRGTSKFATMLKENLSEAERIAVMEVMDEVIMADGVIDGYEVYLRIKLAKLLEVPLKPLKGSGQEGAEKKKEVATEAPQPAQKKKLPGI
jgi:uncharacterized tellurite resistance protein B-like protein